jgi:Zn-dependent peptidase ImmA (M78 family)
MMANVQPNQSPQPSENPLDLGTYLRNLRAHYKFGLREAAGALRVDAGHLSKLERNIGVPPGGELILKLARFYSVPVEELLRRARTRTADTVAADKDIAREIAAFYRLAAGRTKKERLQMLLGALDHLKLSPEEKARWTSELNALAEGGPELLRLANERSSLYSARHAPRRLRAETIEDQAERILAKVFGRLEAYRPPTPIDRLVEHGDDHIAIEVITADDPRGALLDDGSPAVLGMTRFGNDGQPTIAIHEYLFDSADPTTRRRANFTLGHEFYHAIEHLPRMRDLTASAVLNRTHVCSARRSSRSLATPEDWREWQANSFAAAILMPADAVRDLFRQAFGKGAIEVSSDDLDEYARQAALRPVFRDGDTVLSLADLFDVNPRSMGIRLKTLGLITCSSPAS